MLFHKLYGFNQLQVSLMFIPIGCGSIVAAVTIGKLVDWNYRRHAAKLGLPITKNRVQDLANFPIEKARVEIVLPACAMAGLFTIAYAWIMMQKLPLVAPVIALFLLSLGLTASSQVMNILIVDIYPGKPSTATAASNIVRCELGAVLTAIILPLIEAIETGWAYTLLASLVLGFTPVLILLMKKGPEWRRVRKIRDEKSAAARLERSNVGTPMTASTTSID
jgi:MFS family permease